MAHRTARERRKATEKAGPSGRDGRGGELEGPQYKTDEFRMFYLKVVLCNKRYCHDWTTCPFAHPGEKARRRDPRKYRYTGIACPEMKQGVDCPRGERCPFAHNVFEYWLHPSRYRTQLCNIAASCNRKICFFAHTIEELRVPAPVGSANASQLLAGAMGGRVNVRSREMGREQGKRTTTREPKEAAGTRRLGGGSPKETLRRVASTVLPRPRGRSPRGESMHGQSMLTSSVQSVHTPSDSGTLPDSQARQLLEMLRSTREQAYQMHPSVAYADVSQVQALLHIIQEQQKLIQQQAQSKSAQDRETQNKTLQSLLGALYCQVTTQTMAEGERERLIKLLSWIFMQVVQSQSLQVFGGEMQGPSEGMERMVLGTGISGTQQASEQVPGAFDGGSTERRNLSSIPETHTAMPRMDLISCGSTIVPGKNRGQPGGRTVGLMPMPAVRMDTEEVHRRRAPINHGNLPAMVAQAVGNRLSMESSLNHSFSTPRGSNHSSAESAMSEFWGVLSRQSGDSTAHSSLSDMQDAWMPDFQGSCRHR